MTQYLVSHPSANLVVMQLKNTTDLSRLVVHARESRAIVRGKNHEIPQIADSLYARRSEAVLGSQPTLADDSEVFTSSAFTTGDSARPNVLFIMDTSGSMDSEVTVYDPAMTYTGTCDAGYVYWATVEHIRSAGLRHDHAQVHAGVKPLPHIVHRACGPMAGGTGACSSSTRRHGLGDLAADVPIARSSAEATAATMATRSRSSGAVRLQPKSP